MNIGFSFVTLQGLGKAPWEIDRLQRAETGFARMSAPSLKNLPGGGHVFSCKLRVNKVVFCGIIIS